MQKNDSCIRMTLADATLVFSELADLTSHLELIHYLKHPTVIWHKKKPACHYLVNAASAPQSDGLCREDGKVNTWAT